MNQDDLQDNIELLLGYAVLEDTGLGEFCSALCFLAESSHYGISEGFNLAMGVEVKKQLSFFQKNCTIIEKEEASMSRWQELWDIAWENGINGSSED